MSQTAIVRTCDVLIFGGSSAAVAAAVSAHDAGASVFVVAPRNYLGDDICGSLQLHLDKELVSEHPLGQQLLLDNPSPRALKREIDEALVSRDIGFVFGSFPVAALHDEDGALAGAMIANRAGRQAIEASCIIDATPRALFARLAGAAFHSFEAQTINYRRRLLADAGLQLDGYTELPGHVTDEENDGERHFAVYERSDVFELSGCGPQQLARFEQHSYQSSWRPEARMLAEDSIYTLNDRLRAEHCSDVSKLAPHHGSCLDDRCFVLSSCADLGDDAAARSLTAGQLLPAADRFGAYAAERSHAVERGTATNSFCQNAQLPTTGTLQLRSNGLRPIDSGLPIFENDTETVPLLDHYDVAVVGGGTGGAPAGIAAARQHAGTIILEFQSHLGGVGTVGQISVYYFGNRIGFTHEVDEGVHAMGPEPAHKADSGRWNPSWKQAWYHKSASEAGADIWYQSTVYGVQMTGNRVSGIMVAGPFGHGLITCGAAVDCTGAAEVAANAGAPVRVIDDSHIAVQGTGLSPVSPVRDYNNTDHNFIDDEDMVDVTAAMVAATYKFDKDFDICQLVNSRERQQIIGEWEVSPLDILCDRQFPDTVCRAYSNFDSHGFTIHPLFMIKAPDKVCHYANVPYRALIPRDIDGVLVTGLGVSAHRDSLPLIRMQADVQNQGYAAGCAAAMSAQQQCGIRDISIKKLQQHLIEQECLENHQLLASDNFPLSQDVLAFMVNEEWDTYRGISVMLGHARECKALIEDALAASDNTEQRLRYAHILCIQGDSKHAALLTDYLKNNDWDDGWNYKGMGQFGFSLSRIDTYIVALSRCADTAAAALIINKAQDLELPCDFSHARALALAAEHFHQRGINVQSWIPVLREMLEHSDMHGFAHTDLKAVLAALTPDRCETAVRNRSLREIVLARALWLLGDQDGQAADSLRDYAADMRGHFARHARALLAQAPQHALH